MAALGFRTRSPVKQDLILNCLRSEIVDGKMHPGERLPTRADLERRFQVSNATLQRALDRLMSEGFIYARGTMGTFVATEPPHLAHIGMVVPMMPHDEKYSRFFATLTQEAGRFEKVHNRTLTVYFGGGGHTDNDHYRRLVRHLQHRRVKGLIFTHPPHWYLGTPLLELPGISRVAICQQPLPVPGVAMVRLARETVFSRGLDILLARGRRRLAIISNSGDSANRTVAEGWVHLARERGMDTGLHWVQGASIEFPGTASNIARLLMHGRAEERPDALMILDDNLVEYATAGVLAAGMRVPDDLDVVAHCNFPWPTPSVLPVSRLGFNNTEVVARCVELVDRLSRGEAVPPVTEIAAVQEDEANGTSQPLL